MEADRQISPEDLTAISEGLEKLPPRFRQVFLLRHYVGMKIGSDTLANDEAGELTLAAHFGRDWPNDSQLVEGSGTDYWPSSRRSTMANRIEPTLDDALSTFVEDKRPADRRECQEWVNRYPQFRHDSG